VLIIGTAVVYLQIQHAKNRPLGYDSSGLVSASSSKDIHSHLDAMRKELKENDALVEIAEASSSVTYGYSSSSRFEWNGKDPNLSVDFSVNSVSPEYGNTIGWTIIKGRDFSRERLADSTGMILNRAAADYIGLKEPIGETIRWGGDPYEVVGIADNMIINSPYQEAAPNIYVMNTKGDNVIIFRLNPAQPAAVSLAKIESVYKKYSPENTFDYEFTDVAYARKFGNEERVGTLATTLACLAVFISCLGIFGLSSFTAEQRTKEIGVRKVLGASTYDLWQMMSKDFVILATMSCIIAVPIAYLILNNWLENFKYHMGIPLWTFFAATGATLAITLITVSWHTLIAAGSNPVKSLKVD
jgi:ABC-type antimicrobial peptide transport system permease subunit